MTGFSSDAAQLLAVLGGGREVIQVVPVVAVAIGFILTGDKKTTYSASAQVLVGRPDIADLNGLLVADPDRVTATLARLARVQPIAERMLADTEVSSRTPDDFLAQIERQREPAASTSSSSPSPTTSARWPPASPTRMRARVHRLPASAEQPVASSCAPRGGAPARRPPRHGPARVSRLGRCSTSGSSPRSRRGFPGERCRSIGNRCIGELANRARAALLAGGLGLVLLDGLAFLAEALDGVRSSAEVERRFGRPILARLQLRSRQLQKSGALVTMRNRRAGERRRVPRAADHFIQRIRPQRTLDRHYQRGGARREDRDGREHGRCARPRRPESDPLRPRRSRPALARAFSLEGKPASPTWSWEQRR